MWGVVWMATGGGGGGRRDGRSSPHSSRFPRQVGRRGRGYEDGAGLVCVGSRPETWTIPPKVGDALTSSAQTYQKPSLWDNPRSPEPASASGSLRSQRTQKSASSKVLNQATAPASTQTATRWRATLNNFPGLDTSFRVRGHSTSSLFSRSRGGVHTPQPPPTSRSSSCAGGEARDREERFSILISRGRKDPRPAQCSPKFLLRQPAHSLRPLPPRPSTPAAPATLSSLQRANNLSL